MDSTGHLPSGLMSGTLTSLGDYDQCLSVKSGNGMNEIVGQYCLLHLKVQMPAKRHVITFKDRLINLNESQFQNTWIDNYVVHILYNFYYFSVTNGICVPSKCTQNDLETIAAKCM